MFLLFSSSLVFSPESTQVKTHTRTRTARVSDWPKAAKHVSLGDGRVHVRA